MRLVKALRRGFLAVSLVCVGCVDERPSQLMAADCEPTLRLPRKPRVVEVRDDGSLLRGPDCASANCLAGTRGVWGYRSDSTSHVAVIGQPALALPHLPASRLVANSLRGVAIGPAIAAVDRGSELEVVEARGRQRFPMPEFAPGETLVSVWRLDDALFVGVRRDKRTTRVLTLIGSRMPRPRPDAVPVINDEGVAEGWLLPGEPAALLTSTGALLPLTMTLSADANVKAFLAAGVYVIRQAPREGWIVSTAGAVLARVPHGTQVRVVDSEVYAIDTRSPGAVLVLRERGFEPYLAAAAGHDIAGERIPAGARIERIEAIGHGSRVLLVERMRLATCTVEDRLIMLDIVSKAARTLAADDVVRLHPTYAGDRFRFVEADAHYESP